MFIGAAELRIYLPHSRSLKDKRMVLQSVLQRSRNQCSISSAEVGMHDEQQSALLGIALAAGEAAFAEERLQFTLGQIEQWLEEQGAQIARVRYDVIPFWPHGE